MQSRAIELRPTFKPDTSPGAHSASESHRQIDADLGIAWRDRMLVQLSRQRVKGIIGGMFE